jgi:hypothetical protein
MSGAQPLPDGESRAGERLALVREAVRQGELRLAAQAQARQVLEVRATATTQILATLTVTLTAARFTLSALDRAGDLPSTFDLEASSRAVSVMVVFATVALILSIASLVVANPARIRAPWRLAGENPRWIMREPPPAEEQVLRDLAARYVRDIGGNETALARMWLMSWLAVATFVAGIFCSYAVAWWPKLFADAAPH